MKALGPSLIVNGQPMAPVGNNDGTAVADELSKLADLHDRGVLANAEFQAQKKKLLGE